MPTAVDSLTKSSSPEQIREAIGSCISTEVDGGRPQDQAIAMCYSMARAKTGKSLNPHPDHMSSREKVNEGLRRK